VVAVRTNLMLGMVDGGGDTGSGGDGEGEEEEEGECG
jgi:hypothetical protein